jgi:hypothetical protein
MQAEKIARDLPVELYDGIGLGELIVKAMST